MAEEKKTYSPAGRKKIYSPEQLEKAVARYFKKISRLKTVTELVPTGELDKYGHEILKAEPVRNLDGEEIQQLEYLITPCVRTLCDFLGIERTTWARYCANPEYSNTTTHVRGRFQSWLEQQLDEREDRRLGGIKFNLENNYGYRNRVDVSSETMEDYLAKLTEGGGEQDF